MKVYKIETHDNIVFENKKRKVLLVYSKEQHIFNGLGLFAKWELIGIAFSYAEAITQSIKDVKEI